MYDSLTSKNFEDFRQRYSGCYGWLTHDNKEILVAITSVKPDRVTFSTSQDTDFFAFADQEVVFKFLPIKRGWYNTDIGPVLLSRIPARQYQRGISSGNTSCQYLRPGLTGSYALVPRALNTKILEDVFTEKTKEVKYTSGGFVVNPFFVFAPFDQTKKEQFLFFLDVHVGSYKEATKKLVLRPSWKHIKQEVVDVISRTGLSSIMEVV